MPIFFRQVGFDGIGIEVGEVGTRFGVMLMEVFLDIVSDTFEFVVILVQLVLVQEVEVVVVDRSGRGGSQSFLGCGITFPTLRRLSCSVPGFGAFPDFHNGHEWKLW